MCIMYAFLHARLATFYFTVYSAADSRGAVVINWRKYVHEVLLNRLGGLSLPNKSVVSLTDRPDMTLDVYTTTTTIFYVLSYNGTFLMYVRFSYILVRFDYASPGIR